VVVNLETVNRCNRLYSDANSAAMASMTTPRMQRNVLTRRWRRNCTILSSTSCGTGDTKDI
jgi:hypothetical protein